jgi:Flp pilus assembly protein TadD
MEGAEASFRQAVDASPQDERARGEYAQLLWKRGATTEAVRHMTEAVRLSGGSPKLLVELGEMQLALGDLNGRKAALSGPFKPIRIMPEHKYSAAMSLGD